ncbi:hypothetical protein CCH79_00003852, partial [Gambusia affinis]
MLRAGQASLRQPQPALPVVSRSSPSFCLPPSPVLPGLINCMLFAKVSAPCAAGWNPPYCVSQISAALHIARKQGKPDSDTNEMYGRTPTLVSHCVGNCSMAPWRFLTRLTRSDSGPAGSGDVMAFLTLFVRRQLPQAVSYFVRAVELGRPGCGGVPLRRLHGSARQRVGEKGPWSKSQRGPEQPLQQYHLTDLDKADALMLRKSHETGFLSWFRNGLLATGIGVIAFVQSEVGREAGY